MLCSLLLIMTPSLAHGLSHLFPCSMFFQSCSHGVDDGAAQRWWSQYLDLSGEAQQVAHQFTLVDIGEGEVDMAIGLKSLRLGAVALHILDPGCGTGGEKRSSAWLSSPPAKMP